MDTITRHLRWPIAVAALLGTALLGTAPLGAAPLRAQAGARAPADTAASPVVLREVDMLAFVDEPDEHLADARRALAAHDPAGAAHQIGTAATFVRVGAGTARGTDQADLLEAAGDLDRVAAEIRAGGVRTPRELDLALRRTDRALARHHLERAQRAWARKQASTTGRELHGAARYTERLAQDAGRDVEHGTRDVVRGTRRLGSKLIDGVGWTAGEVGKGFSALGRERDRLGVRAASGR
jgi:hypothetical protein